MTQRKYKLSIPINFDLPDAGYSVLKSKKVIHYLLAQLQRGNNLIQTCKPFTLHQTTLCLQSKKFTQWVNKPTWNDISCTSDSDWIKRTPCTIGKNNKVFVKYRSNEYVAGFGIYLLMIMSGEITEKKHVEFISVLRKTMTHVIVHNEDVDWFHLKEAI
jgi:hypothetical protein